MKKLIFKACDGEAVKTPGGKDAYVLFRVDGYEPPLIKPEGISTEDIINYIFSISNSYTLIGYGMGYDFENFLVDVTQEEYKRLITKERVYFDRYKASLRMVPEKVLIFSKNVNGRVQERKIYNVYHFFQLSFIEALKSMNLGHLVEETIVEGKENRGNFTIDKLKEIDHYNKVEVAALTKLMETFYQYALDAFEQGDIPLEFTEDMLLSPGRFGRQMLDKSNWLDEHPEYSIPEGGIEDFNASLVGLHPYATKEDKTSAASPFLASYYGGRIEAGALGKWEKAYMRDINSAYPKATTMLPKWKLEDFVYTNNQHNIQTAIITRRIGQYFIEWDLPDDWDYYPFPFRAKSKAVIFPSKGKGWIMSPELFAAIDTGIKGFKVTRAIYLKGTEGCGDGSKVKNESTSTAMINKVYDKRLEFKADKNGAEKPLKLIINALYGVVFGQLSDLAGSWITSYTRAMIWRAVAPYKTGHQVIQIMTDSVFSKVPIDLPTGKALGEWGEDIYYNLRVLQPGVYDWYTEDGKRKFKIRSHNKHAFNFDEAFKRLTGEISEYKYTYSQFIGHLQAYHQNLKYGDKLLQWVDVEKAYVPTVDSKREDDESPIPPGQSEKWCPPMINREAGKLFQKALETFE